MRHYENVGLVAPSGRSLGGFRLYTESEVRRLVLVRRMRPLGFSTVDVRAYHDVLDRLPGLGGPAAENDEQAYEELVAKLRKYWVQADARCEDLRRELGTAEAFARSLHEQLSHLLDAPAAGSKAAR
ncbi:MerR family transcriptional regulator [Streptomyces sp. SM11]|uniref:MerR family transcriptional regulator n=1 Tax=Streptomyces sp. SM11 TaxID=565557 RepID=UPI0027E3F256|nr:MerR family transcriptional regulator [Streptomyces sp. SM11]